MGTVMAVAASSPARPRESAVLRIGPSNLQFTTLLLVT
jgi:hypothetical protein